MMNVPKTFPLIFLHFPNITPTFVSNFILNTFYQYKKFSLKLIHFILIMKFVPNLILVEI